MNALPLIAQSESLWDVLRDFQWLTVLWLVGLGGCTGSFLNVVIYRMPAGKSIVHPGSHCPQCGHAIRWYDNIPVISWFVLRAKCRDCGTRIAARYPLVEGLVAALFGILAVVEVFSDGGNLPLSTGVQISFPMLWAVYAFHLVLLTTLMGVTFVRYDGHRIPWQLVAPALAIGAVAPVFAKELHPLPLWPELPDRIVSLGWSAGLLNAAAGLLAGAVAAMLTWPATAGGPEGRSGWASGWYGTTLAGLFLGWQSVCGLVLVTTVVFLLATLLSRWVNALRRVPWTAALLVATFTWIVAWRPIAESMTIERLADPAIVVYAAIGILGGATLSKVVASETEDQRPKTEDRRPKTEDRRPKTEDRRPKTED